MGRKNIGIIAAILLYFSICLLVFLPVIANPGSVLYGKIGDASGAVWLFWIFGEYNSLTPNIDIINYPQGLDFFGTAQLPSHLFVIVPLSRAIGILQTYNLFLFLGFFLSAVSMFFLARHFLKDNVPSFVSGLVFGFCPYIVMKATDQAALMHLEFVAFFVLALFLFKEKPGMLRAALLAFSLFLVPFFEVYYFFFCMVFLAIFLVFYLYKPVVSYLQSRNFEAFYPIKRFVLPSAFFVAVFLVLFFAVEFPLLFPGVQGFGSGLGAQGLRGSVYGVIYFSAKPVQFITPSVYHPLLGGIALEVIPSAASADFAEGTLYVGIMVLVLSFFALLEYKHNRIVQFFLFSIVAVLALMQGPLLRYINIFGIAFAFFPIIFGLWLFYIGRKNFAKLFFALTLVLVFLPLFYGFVPQLQQTSVGFEGLETGSEKTVLDYLERFDYFPVPMTSLALHSVIPFFRVYDRLAVFLMLGLAVLAGFGAKKLLAVQKTEKKKYAVAVLVCAVLLFEFAAFPPAKVTQMLPMPQEYEWLGQQGKVAVAEYPLSMFSYYAFYQQFHKKPMFNSLDLGSGLGEKQEFIKLSEQKTIDALKEKGITHVIVHAGSSQFFSQNFADQKYFRQEYDSSDEASQINSFVFGEGYKRLKGVKLVQEFGETFVFGLE